MQLHSAFFSVHLELFEIVRQRSHNCACHFVLITALLDLLEVLFSVDVPQFEQCGWALIVTQDLVITEFHGTIGEGQTIELLT